MKSTLTTREKTSRMVRIALLMALEVVLTLLYIPVGTINLNFGLIPIVIAAIFLGPGAGVIVGGVSGVVTAVQMFTVPNIFYELLLIENPAAACVLCVVKTAAAGLAVAYIYKLMDKVCKYFTVNTLVAAIVCPVMNTGIFAAGMFLVFGDALVNHPVISTWGVGLAGIVFVGLIGANFFVELLLVALVSPALCKALQAAKIFSK